MWYRVLLFSATLLLFPSLSFARPYDCPGSDSKAREKYLCMVSGKLCPKFMDSYNRIAKQFEINRDRILDSIDVCEANVQERFNSCMRRNRSERACQRARNRGLRGCSRRANRGISRIGGPAIGLANSLAGECARSSHPKAKPCETAEAAPYCDALRNAFDTYVPIIRDRSKGTRERLAAIESLLLAIRGILRQRCAVVRQEIQSSGFTCKPKTKGCKGAGKIAVPMLRSSWLDLDPFSQADMCTIPSEPDPEDSPDVTPTATPEASPTDTPGATPSPI
jgi:hypothetical protein